MVRNLKIDHDHFSHNLHQFIIQECNKLEISPIYVLRCGYTFPPILLSCCLCLDRLCQLWYEVSPVNIDTACVLRCAIHNAQ